jgi:hypothetical protein
MDSSDRLLWRHDPFDIVPAPPCGQPFGGYCPAPASSLPFLLRQEEEAEQHQQNGSSSLFPQEEQQVQQNSSSSFSFFAFQLPSPPFVTFLALSLISSGLSFLALSFCKRRSAYHL